MACSLRASLEFTIKKAGYSCTLSSNLDPRRAVHASTENSLQKHFQAKVSTYSPTTPAGNLPRRHKIRILNAGRFGREELHVSPLPLTETDWVIPPWHQRGCEAQKLTMPKSSDKAARQTVSNSSVVQRWRHWSFPGVLTLFSSADKNLTGIICTRSSSIDWFHWKCNIVAFSCSAPFLNTNQVSPWRM